MARCISIFSRRPHLLDPLFAVLFTVAILVPRACATRAPRAVQTPTWWRTVGTNLVDGSGRRVFLNGFNDQSLAYGQGNGLDRCGLTYYAAPGQMFENLREWGRGEFTTIREHISWADLEPTAPTVQRDGRLVHHWNEFYLRDLDQFVSDARANGIKIVFVMTQVGLSPAYSNFGSGRCEGAGLPTWMFPQAIHYPHDPVYDFVNGWCQFLNNQAEPGVPEPPQAGFAAAWREIARRYADEPTVSGLDLLNEPLDQHYCNTIVHDPVPMTYLQTLYGRAANAIRSVDPRVTIIVEPSPQVPPFTSPVPVIPGRLDNVVYSYHFYPDSFTGDPNGAPLLTYEDTYARVHDVPLWIGEFVPFGGGRNSTPLAVPAWNNNPDWQRETEAELSYDRRYGISWSMQNYDSIPSSITLSVDNDRRPKPRLLTILRRGVGHSSSPASFVAPTTGRVAVGIRLQATDPMPTDAGLRYRWRFGDGTTSAGAARQAVDHAYSRPGVYTVTLEASDHLGQHIAISHAILVTAGHPVA